MIPPAINRCSRRYVEGQCERLSCHTGPCALTSSNGRWVDPVVWPYEDAPFDAHHVRWLLEENKRYRSALEGIAAAARMHDDHGIEYLANEALRATPQAGKADP